MQTSFGVRDFNIVGATGDPVIESNTGSLTIRSTTTSVVGVLSVTDSISGRHGRVPTNPQSNAYVLLATDAGQLISAQNNVTVNSSLFQSGDTITVYNDSGSSISITQGAGVTLRLAGGSTTGTRTLAQRGICTIISVNNNGIEFVVSGTGLS